jgi:hypothetical protein
MGSYFWLEYFVTILLLILEEEVLFTRKNRDLAYLNLKIKTMKATIPRC